MAPRYNHPLKPTESELEILQILWQLGPCTVRSVHEILLTTKDAGYTTTLKLMQIMHEKGLVERNESQKTHVYTALAQKTETQQQLAGKMMQGLFQGSASQLLMHAIGDSKPSQAEIEAIQKLLDDLK
ncbi:MAG: BlaI/MecI/CopY family transcriptional regulator [Bacteroidetes bacterium]|nr:MAG: BlaI/MecI/CopY family transcriptional regulator [Bacteroidota bacterium]